MNAKQYVNLNDVIGAKAYEYGIPVISFDNLVLLGKRAAKVYQLDERANRITFDQICNYIKLYISTPFGNSVLNQLLKE